MYTLLYDSMIGWYARRKVAASYLHLYAVTTLVSMAFINIASIVVLCAYWNNAWAEKLLAAGKVPWASAILAAALLATHMLYFRRRRPAAVSKSRTDIPQRSRWIAGIYMLVSVVVFLYVSTLVPLVHE